MAQVLKMHVCGTCKTLIEGRSISALGKEYEQDAKEVAPLRYVALLLPADYT
jgi:succinate dehydrogenase/fumarate reductase-like Fe-S protein